MSLALSAEELAQLKQFVRAVYDARLSKFFGKLEKHSELGAETVAEGYVRVTAPDYDLDEFRSFLTAFRKIAMSASDPTYLPTIRNIVSKVGNDRLREELKKLKKNIVPIIEGRFSIMRLKMHTASGSVELTAHEILNVLVNGRVFHADETLADKEAAISECQPWHYIWPMRNEIFIPVVNASVWLVNVIRSEQILQESEFPMGKPQPVWETP